MLYLEELLEAVIADEGQTLMGLDFITNTLGLSMSKIDLIFRKALSEYSERRPMKLTEIIRSYVRLEESAEGTAGVLQMPEGTTSCRVSRYGILPNQMPRYYIPKFSEQQVEFDPVTLELKVWPPISPLRVTYTKKYVPTTDVLISGKIYNSYETDEAFLTLPTMFGGKTLKFEKAVMITDPETGEQVPEILSMSPVAGVIENEFTGEKIIELDGTLGTGTIDVETREVNLNLDDTSIAPITYSYYPKYSVVKELDIGKYVLTKMFAYRLMESLASLKNQATQEKLHNIDLQDNLYERARELKQEVREICRSTFSFGDAAPM